MYLILLALFFSLCVSYCLTSQHISTPSADRPTYTVILSLDGYQASLHTFIPLSIYLNQVETGRYSQCCTETNKYSLKCSLNHCICCLQASGFFLQILTYPSLSLTSSLSSATPTVPTDIPDYPDVYAHSVMTAGYTEHKFLFFLLTHAHALPQTALFQMYPSINGNQNRVGGKMQRLNRDFLLERDARKLVGRVKLDPGLYCASQKVRATPE